MISFIRRCHETATRPITIEEVFDAIKTGAHGLKERITQIRNRYESELAITGDPEKARKAAADPKMELPGFLASGLFSERANDKLVDYNPILVADVDGIGDERAREMKEILKRLPFVRAVALSPTASGLKVFINVINDPARHGDSFRSIQENFLDCFGIKIDEKCKDLARICFFTYDPDLWVRAEGNEPMPPADPLPSPIRSHTPGLIPPDLTAREQVSYRLVGDLRFSPEKNGYFCDCPGQHLHTNKTADKHTILYLESVPTLVCQHESCGIVVEAFNKLLRSEIGKAENLNLSHISSPYREVRHETILANPNGANNLTQEISLVSISSPSIMRITTEPPEVQLIGDYHICKDGTHISVVAGPPGVGKSLGGISLGVAGAIGAGEWFGLKIHRKFKTMILQSENGLYRLSRIFKELDCDMLEDYLRVSEPPPFGFLFKRQDFRNQLEAEIKKFMPDLIVLDPWNSVAIDQEQATYLDTFNLIRSVLPQGKDSPALVIVAHTRKPKSDERSSGRALMHMVAGSHVLVSVPRTVFVMQPASDDVEDDGVVWTCCKNNDGELGPRTAWRRKIGLFDQMPGFDWDTFDAENKDKRVVVTAEMVEEVFESGQLLLTEARDKLLEISGASKASVYRALSKKKSRFVDNLSFQGKFVNWTRS